MKIISVPNQMMLVDETEAEEHTELLDSNTYME